MTKCYAKVLEKCFKKKLIAFLDAHNFLSELQFVTVEFCNCKIFSDGHCIPSMTIIQKYMGRFLSNNKYSFTVSVLNGHVEQFLPSPDIPNIPAIPKIQKDIQHLLVLHYK